MVPHDTTREGVTSATGVDPENYIGVELNAKWTLVRLLGVGGTSAVYEARHRNGRRAAVKLLSRSAKRNLAQARRLAKSEARIANEVDHPGVIAVLDDDISKDGTPYLVMELLDGKTLENVRLANGGRLELARALPIFESVLEVLAAFHARGIVHRDIKPENVFVLRSGLVKVLDFGLATGGNRILEDSPWFGTPGFMPPEQARARWAHVDARSDLWAAAATFYAVVTGKLVHRGTTSRVLVRAAATDEVDLDAGHALPIEIVDVLQRALAFDHADRWPSALAMLSALRSARLRPHRRSEPRLRLARPLPVSDSRTRLFQLVRTPIAS